MSDAETRAEPIDPALKAAGWGVVEGNRIRREDVIIPGRIEGKNKRGKVLKANDLLEHQNTIVFEKIHGIPGHTCVGGIQSVSL